MKILNANIELPNDLTVEIKVNKANIEAPTKGGTNETTENKNPTTDNSEQNNKRIKPSDEYEESTTSGTKENNSDESILKSVNKTSEDDILEERAKKKPIMAESFGYLSNTSKIISNTYKGDPNGLRTFIASIELAASATTDDQQDTLVKIIKTKLEGRTLGALPSTVSTAQDIIDALERKVKPDGSTVVVGRLLALKAERGSLQKFQRDAEELADQLRRAYINFRGNYGGNFRGNYGGNVQKCT